MLAVGTLFFAVACNSGEEKSDTVIIEKETTTSTPAPAEEEESSISLEANVDKEGNVSGGVSGNIEIDDDK